MSKRSEQADKIYNLLCQNKIFEAKMESITLAALLRLDERCDEFLKNTDEIFKKVFHK